MFNQLFGNYLVNEEIISDNKLRELLEKASKQRVKLGTIAVAEGYLSQEEADEVNHLQKKKDKRFGDIAVEQGYLEEEQVEYLLSQQSNPFMQFIQLLFEDDLLAPNELEWSLNDFQEQNGFTDDEMDALKQDDLDAIVNLFALAYKPYVTDLVGLLLRNLIRFVTDDFYIGHIERVDEVSSNAMVMQRIFGDNTIYLGVLASDTEDGFISFAEIFAKEKFKKINSLVFDSINEFVNMTMGLFATNLSYEKIRMNMEPPCAYTNQVVQGKAYILPMYVQGMRIDIYVAVDSDLIFAKEPLDLNIEKRMGNKADSYSRGNIVIVDDSAFARKVIRGLLEDEGYTIVSEATNGEEGIEAYKKYRPDVITMDITMPVMNGVEAVKQIFQFDKDAKVIMVTAAGQEKKVIEALQMGVKNFIVKPFKNEDIVHAVKECFDE